MLPLQLQKDEKKNYSKSSSVRRIFERGGGARKFENIENKEDQNESFPPQNQVRFPAQNLVKTKKKGDFGPKLSEYQKKERSSVKKEKGLHSNLVRFLAQNYVKAKKKVFAHHFCAQTLCPSYKGRGHAAISHTILCYLYYPGDPKGGGGGAIGHKLIKKW